MDSASQHVNDHAPVQTWADGYGVWHVRVKRSVVSPLIAARRALRDELQARYGDLPREIWLHPIECQDLSNAEYIVYREGSIDSD